MGGLIIAALVNQVRTEYFLIITAFAIQVDFFIFFYIYKKNFKYKGYYDDLINDNCQNCDDRCLTCTGPGNTNCSTC